MYCHCALRTAPTIKERHMGFDKLMRHTVYVLCGLAALFELMILSFAYSTTNQNFELVRPGGGHRLYPVFAISMSTHFVNGLSLTVIVLACVASVLAIQQRQRGVQLTILAAGLIVPALFNSA